MCSSHGHALHLPPDREVGAEGHGRPRRKDTRKATGGLRNMRVKQMGKEFQVYCGP